MKTGNKIWSSFSEKHPTIAEFIKFFIISNGVTVLQLILMPIFKYFFSTTNLINIDFQEFRVGSVGGEPYYIFDYPSGNIADGGGGGLAYFLAVQITLLIAQIINFFMQRNFTFKSTSSIKKAAFWYAVAYIAISFGAAALQGFYKDPIYNFLQDLMGSAGITVADFVTMIINATISFWVYFPIMKIIFKQDD